VRPERKTQSDSLPIRTISFRHRTVDRAVNVVITNPELVKPGLDLLEFPTIIFMQSDWNVYTLQQAARRSWRFGQPQAVHVIFLGYADISACSCWLEDHGVPEYVGRHTRLWIGRAESRRRLG